MDMVKVPSLVKFQMRVSFLVGLQMAGCLRMMFLISSGRLKEILSRFHCPFSTILTTRFLRSLEGVLQFLF